MHLKLGVGGGKGEIIDSFLSGKKVYGELIEGVWQIIRLNLKFLGFLLDEFTFGIFLFDEIVLSKFRNKFSFVQDVGEHRLACIREQSLCRHRSQTVQPLVIETTPEIYGHLIALFQCLISCDDTSVFGMHVS